MPTSRKSKRPSNRTSRKKIKKAVVAAEAEEEVDQPSSLPSTVPDVTEVLLEPEVVEVKPKKRYMLTRDELETNFNVFLDMLDRELQNTKTDKQRKVSVKTWRSLIKEAKQLKTSSLKVTKKPKRRNKNNKESGFMKPVPISTEMANFAGWDPEKLHSRVDVTKFLCDYIREHDLQNPEDRRQILADEKLKSLLRYDSSVDTEPLTYYYMQKKIQPHFT